MPCVRREPLDPPELAVLRMVRVTAAQLVEENEWAFIPEYGEGEEIVMSGPRTTVECQ
jgi:hypothetical protein